MADDSEKMREEFEFHPCDTPRGMMYYKLEELTINAQTRLNEFKLDVIRENQKYLNEHTEIKAIISILLKAILKARPKIDVRQFLTKYLMESWSEIQKEIEKHVAERRERMALKKTVSATSYFKGMYGESEEEFQFASEESLLQVSLASPMDQDSTEVLCRSILDEIVDNVDAEKVPYPTGGSWLGNWPAELDIDIDTPCPSLTGSVGSNVSDIADNVSEYHGE